MKYIVRLRDKPESSLVGGKAGNLAILQKRGFLVPESFVILPSAFIASLTQQQQQIFEEFSKAENFNISLLQNLLIPLQPSEVIQLELLQILAELFPYGGLFAVRSSGLEEDSQAHSFAGQLESFLGIEPDNLREKIADVWRSGFSPRVISYRQQKGLPLLPSPPAVLVQQMLNPIVSGVAFGADPVREQRNLTIITAVYGLGTSLVSGENDADTFYVNGEGEIIQRAIANKTILHQLHPDRQPGIYISEVARELVDQPSLEDKTVKEIAQLVKRVGQHFSTPQDVEWAIIKNAIYVLQSRPITSPPPVPSLQTGIYHLWDNSNIAESYSGVTTPLTFSFARRAYEEVYRQFCHFFGVSKGTISRNDNTFRNMIGFLEGRIYYNLLNWYRVLSLLPGFRLNRQFMEQMMGVKEPLPQSIITELEEANWRDRVRDSWQLLKTVFGLIRNYFLLPTKIGRFYRRLNRSLALKDNGENFLTSLQADELGSYYRHLENQLLSRWDAPLINDFLAMIFYGVLRSLTEKWCGDTNGTLQNGLLSDRRGIISTEPIQRIQEMVALIDEDVEFVKTLNQGSLETILGVMKRQPEFKNLYQAYLAKFSDRCLDELKLESPTLADDPLPLLRTIGLLAKTKREPEIEPKPLPIAEKKASLFQIKRSLRPHPWRWLVFHWVLKNARERVRDRENLRFERTRVFGRARQIFLEIGKRFYVADLLQQPQDIFYLQVEEILGLIEGTSSCTNLKGLVILRQQEFARYQNSPPLPSRLETYGIPYLNLKHSFTPEISTLSPPSLTEQKQGLGCSPGRVRGTVRIITNPKQVLTADHLPTLHPGTILVAERTDPGWILLFSIAAGLLVERGSLLSHAAIVSRELGLPAIVSLPHLTQWLKDGDLVEMDGTTGIVTKLGEKCDR